MARELNEETEVEEILRRQDEALLLVERLRLEEPFERPRGDRAPEGRRDFRRWPTPEGIELELHDGERWHPMTILDMGTGGVRVGNLPRWAEGPVPARLKAPGIPSIIALADMMWRDAPSGKAGLRFEFLDDEEREQWADGLIDALLVRYAVG